MGAYARRIRNIWVHPGNRGARTASLLRAVRWRLQLALTETPSSICTFGGLKFRAANDAVSRAIAYYGPWYEFNEMKFLSRYLRPGDCVLDVGANAGIYSLLAASLVGTGGHIDAIEPVVATASRLVENVRANGLENTIRVHNVAVGDTDGTVDMTDSYDSTNHVVMNGSGVPVRCVRLDTLMGQRSYAFAKIDIEGMELVALKGASERLLTGDPPLWMIEVNGALFRYGLAVGELVDWVHARGYDVAAYDHALTTMTVTCQPWGNVFLVKRDAWSQILRRFPDLRVAYEKRLP